MIQRRTTPLNGHQMAFQFSSPQTEVETAIYMSCVRTVAACGILPAIRRLTVGQLGQRMGDGLASRPCEKATWTSSPCQPRHARRLELARVQPGNLMSNVRFPPIPDVRRLGLLSTHCGHSRVPENPLGRRHAYPV